MYGHNDKMVAGQHLRDVLRQLMNSEH